MKTLRVVFHEATRTGSPRVLLDLLRHVRPLLDVAIDVELITGGPLSNELLELKTDPTPRDPPSAVLINSALAAAEASRFGEGTRVAAYVHEVGEALRTLPEEASDSLRNRCDLVWCVSDQSAHDLAALGVSPARTRVLPPIVRDDLSVSPAEVVSARRLVGLSTDQQLIVGCGEASWRKGADLFLELSRRLAADPDLMFVWIGRRPRAFGRVLDQDTRNLGLEDRVVWTGELEDPAPLLAAASVVVVPSREDPQPLVPLEAALLGTPSAGFDTDGMASMGMAGAALTAPYPDTLELAAATRRILANGSLQHELVLSATERVAGSHSLDAIGTRFLDQVRELVETDLSPGERKLDT